MGGGAGGSVTSGILNTFAGVDSGSVFTTGTRNTILGRYSGNQNSLDLRTASNNIVLSDGDGNPRMHINSSGTMSDITSGGDVRFVVYTSGNVQNTNNSYAGISDIKLKENVVDATSKLDELNQVRIRNWNFIGETKKQIGVVAQELETIFPALVEEMPDTDSDGTDLGTTTKSVKYSIFVPMLIKAMQEQTAIITALTARIETLEG